MAPKLDPKTAQALFAKGQLSKEYMDQVYGDLAADEAADEAQLKDVVATDIAQAITQNPEVAQVAEAVTSKLAFDANAKAPIAPQVAQAPVAKDPLAEIVTRPGVGQQIAAGVRNGVDALGRAVSVAPSESVQNLMATAAPAAAPQQQAPVAQAPVDTSEYQVVANQQTQNAQAAADVGNTSGMMSEAEKAINTIKSGIIQQAAAAQGTAANIQSAFNDAINKMEVQSKDYAARNAELMKGYDSEMVKQKEAIQQFEGEKVDPNRYWGSLSTGEKVLSLVSVFLSGATGTGPTNKALDVIQSAIDTDIATQKANIAVKKDGLDMRDSFLSKISARVSSEAQAEQLTKAYMLEQVKMRVDMASVQGEAAKAQAQMSQALGELQLKALKTAQEYAVLDVNAGNVSAALGEDIPTLDENTDYIGLSKKYKGQVIPGVGVARSKEAATKAAQKISSYRGVREKLQDLEELVSKYGVESLPSAAKVRASSIARDIFLGIKQAEGLGALDKGSVEFGQGMISNDPLASRGFDVMGIGTRVGNRIAGENLSLTQVKQMKDRFDTNFRNNLAVDMLAISPKIKKELLSAGNTDYANKNAKSVGKAVAP